MTRAAALLLFSACAASAANVSPLDQGLDALRAGDDGRAIALFRQAADQGDARAEGMLGRMYEEGRGVPPSAAEAVQWYARSAAHGHAGSAGILGGMYAQGRGVPADLGKARAWFERGAAGGDAYSRRMLSAMSRPVPEAERTSATPWKERRGPPRRGRLNILMSGLTALIALVVSLLRGRSATTPTEALRPEDAPYRRGPFLDP